VTPVALQLKPLFSTIYIAEDIAPLRLNKRYTLESTASMVLNLGMILRYRPISGIGEEYA
jgi:hypothetical protein